MLRVYDVYDVVYLMGTPLSIRIKTHEAVTSDWKCFSTNNLKERTIPIHYYNDSNMVLDSRMHWIKNDYLMFLWNAQIILHWKSLTE